jgi:hypothetical protein
MEEEVMKIEFTSVWNDGSDVVTTPGTYDPKTGEVDAEVSKGPIPEGTLDREFITLPNGDEKDVCTTCHSYVLKKVVGDRADCSYGELEECSDPTCESNDPPEEEVA